MKHHRKRVATTGVAAVAALVVTVLFVVPALATPPSRVVTTTFGVGRFDNIDSTTKTDINPGAATDFWQARVNTKGASDLYVLQNTIAPGGTFGWHSHPGPSLVIVKAETLTFYEASDPSCTPSVHTVGDAYVDEGTDVHVARNEGTVDAIVIVTRIIPEGSAPRIDEPDPGTCPF